MKRLVAMVVAVLLGGMILSGSAHAQTPSPTATPTASNVPSGVISGTVRNGTAGAATPALAMQLIAVQANGQITAQTQQTSDGAFRFEAPADPTVRYLLRTEHDGVPYIDPSPVLISRELPTAQRDISVWETTSTRPALRIARTVVFLEGVDTERGRVQLRREDAVINPTDRVYVGGDDRRTLRIPASDGVIAVDEQQTVDATASLEGQVVATTQPIRPGETLVTTRTLAEYVPSSNAYAVRVTAPLATDAIEVRAPQSLVRRVQATSNATGAPAVEDLGEQWLVAKRTGAAREGEGMVATLTGLGGVQPPNPLTSKLGASAAAGVSLAVLVGAFAAIARLRGATARSEAAA